MRAKGSVLVLLGLAAAGACKETGGPAPQGLLVVGNSTFGTNLDSNGYRVTIDGGDSLRISVNQFGAWLLSPGTYGVALSDLQANCATDESNAASTGPNPQDAAVAAQDTTFVWFAVVCS